MRLLPARSRAITGNGVDSSQKQRTIVDQSQASSIVELPLHRDKSNESEGCERGDREHLHTGSFAVGRQSINSTPVPVGRDLGAGIVRYTGQANRLEELVSEGDQVAGRGSEFPGTAPDPIVRSRDQHRSGRHLHVESVSHV
jgi:hypothetical protein